MDSFQSFFGFLHKFVPLSEGEFTRWMRPYISIRSFRPKDMVIRQGETEDYFNYVNRGLLIKYYLEGKEEIVTQIGTEGHIIHAQESFHSRIPSEYNIRALEPTTLLSISYDDLQKIYDIDPKLERLGRLVITFSMVVKDRWQNNMIRMSPRERFLDFMQKNPNLLQRVPQKHLASYLHIQPETFSRFKHLLRAR